jgi:baculoviral IAP repeat-containing protein 6
VLSSYVNPGGAVPQNFFAEEDEDESESESGPEQPQLPMLFHDLLQQSCLLPAVSSYLRNDSGKITVQTGVSTSHRHVCASSMFAVYE